MVGSNIRVSDENYTALRNQQNSLVGEDGGLVITQSQARQINAFADVGGAGISGESVGAGASTFYAMKTLQKEMQGKFEAAGIICFPIIFAP